MLDHPDNISREGSCSPVLYFKYYNKHNFHKLSQTKHISTGTLSFLHTNIKSYQKNISNLCDLVDVLEYKFDIIGLSEAWHSGKKFESVSISGYHPYEFICRKSQNSGCSFYINSNLKYRLRDVLSTTWNVRNEEFEQLFVEIFNERSKNVLVGVIYRHPNKTSIEFQIHMQKLLLEINKENKKIVLMGDFNIDLLQLEDHNEGNKFLEIMLCNFLMPHIVQPTRITTNNNPTLIDNIFYNDISDECVSGNLIPHVTDHLPNFLIIRNNTSRVKKNKKVRDYSNFSMENFRNDLKSINDKNIMATMDNVNVMYEFFHTKLSNILNKHAPLKPMTKAQKKRNGKPWIDKNVIDMIHEKKPTVWNIYENWRQSDLFSI